MAKKRASRKTVKKPSRKKRAARKTTKSVRAPKAGGTAMVVTVSGERPIQEVARDLRAQGFKVGHVLDAIGSVTGSAHSKTKSKLKSIRGVADVSDDHPIDIGPPDAEIS